MHATLLVLAAGMGSRYGGLKQIDPVGPSGETVLDYAVFDAMRAGFDRVVFVIRRDFETVFRQQIGDKYAGQIAVDYVFQSVEALPDGFAPVIGREKPWGTGHAVWCARTAIEENFAVINADDFYGQDSFAQLGKFLGQQNPAGKSGARKDAEELSSPSEFAMVGFRLANTLSEHGAVARGVSVTDKNGWLESITERTGILPENVGIGRMFSGEEIVSMNCWGFTPAFFAGLDQQFREFLAQRGTEPKAEFYLPAAVSTMIALGQARVRVLPTEASWFGVTYREDKPRVVAALAQLVSRGMYPAKLFG
ncbi:MAG TPA: sugar phosphate nucleotidyltransferase [Opitutus sp.]|nr:sugar phosphate nucleotidyltransferase [Opitutus sp.]